MKKTGWIRFMDETPQIGTIIYVAISLSPYNGMSFINITEYTGNEFIIVNSWDNNKIKFLIYSCEDFENKRKKEVFSYAHHWAYYIEENKKINIKQVCESIRIKKGAMFPIKV